MPSVHGLNPGPRRQPERHAAEPERGAKRELDLAKARAASHPPVGTMT
jgi:hypothetical protein